MKLGIMKQTALGACLVLSAATASAADVTFSDFNDSDGSASLFDISANSILGNTLTLGINAFTADGSSAATQAANDTIALVITAPTGFVITGVTYYEEGHGETGNGIALASGSITADGIPKSFLTQFFAPNVGASGWSISPDTIAIANKQSIAVSISNNLFATALGAGETATISKTLATLSVDVAPVPIPPALGMLGAGLVGLVTIGRRKLAA